MTIVSRKSGVLALALLAGVIGAADAPTPKVEVKVVKYAELCKVVRQHMGQVVLLDFWGLT
ncbi:MAG: hypothetical protein K2R98_07365 [Gemmataceae bacterium]|nr:hypothetical protein [Gemmataceae bacterium]